MKNITTFINESWTYKDDYEYEKKCTEYIINVLKNHGVNFEKDFDKKDSDFNYWVRFKSKIKKDELRKIDTELCKVLSSHEVTVGNKLNVNIFKEPRLTIDPEHECIYLYNSVKSYYEKNIENK